MELRLPTLVIALTVFGLVTAVPRRQFISEVETQDDSGEQQVVEILKEICSKSVNDIEADVPRRFNDLVFSLRPLSHAATARIHEKVQRSEICSTQKLQDIWTDALIQDASQGSLQLLAEQIIRREVEPSRASYLLTMMAFAQHPSLEAVQSVLPLLQQEEPQRQALLGVSALIKTHLSQNPENERSAEVKDAVKAIIKYLNKHIKTSNVKVVVALKALRNIGKIEDALETIYRLAADQSQKTDVRVAAIQALQGKAGDQQVVRKAMEILKTQHEEAEIRIAAYKVAIEEADESVVRDILKLLRREDNKQVGSYITSHMMNLRKSSAPRKQNLRRILNDEQIATEKFPKDMRKYSQNFEKSYYSERLGFGGVACADVIYDRSFLPRSIKVNVTIPVEDQEINLIELGFRQVGLDDEVRKMAGPEGIFKGKNVPEIFRQISSMFYNRNNDANEIPSYRFSRSLRSWAQNQKLQGSVYVNFDGKTVAYLDLEDAREQAQNLEMVLESLPQRIESLLKKSLKQDRAFTLMATTRQDRAVAVNATVVIGFKGDENTHTFWPSFAAEFSTRTAKTHLVQRMSSGPGIKFDYQQKGRNGMTVLYKLPKDQLNLFSFTSQVKEIDENGREQDSRPRMESKDQCTQKYHKMFGMEYCIKSSTPKQLVDPAHPIPVANIELTLKKTDRNMEGWEYTIELPESDDSIAQYRAVFRTPGSSEDREVSLEAEIKRGEQVELKFKSPIKSATARATYIWNQGKMGLESQLTVDGRRKYIFEAGVDQVVQGKKSEWSPRLRIEAPRMTPVAFSGKIQVDRSRKSQVNFDLRNGRDERQFVRGSFMADGSFEQSLRVSSDIQAELGFISFRVFGNTDKQEDKSLTSDLQMEYQRSNSRKENVKITSKVQNLSSDKASKINSFIEVSMTEFPDKNVHVSWNGQMKNNELVENEFFAMWGRDMSKVEKRIHILQVSKFTETGMTASTENVLKVQVAPLRVDYEVKASGYIEKSETPKFKVQLEASDETKQGQRIKTAFEYQHISRRPLKLTMDALLSLPSREITYSDKLEEVANNEFRGNTQFQWHQEKKMNINYHYKIKNDARTIHHEIDAQIKTPSMNFPTQHVGLFRMTDDDLEIKSKLSHEKQKIWDLETLLSKNQKSHFAMDAQAGSIKAEASPYGSVKSALIDITGKTIPFSHHSNCRIGSDSNGFWSVSSKTVLNQKPILTINAHKDIPRDLTRVSIESALADARFESNLGSSTKAATLDIKAKAFQTNHKTTLIADSNKVEIKSKTQVAGQNWANIEAHVAKKAQSYVNLECPHLTGAATLDMSSKPMTGSLDLVARNKDQHHHKTEFSVSDSEIQIKSKTKKRAGLVADIDARFSKQSHVRLATESLQGNFELDRTTRKPSSKLQFTHHPTGIEHNSEFECEKNFRSWSLISSTKKNNEELVNVQAGHEAGKSGMKVTSQKGEMNVEYQPQKSGKFELKGKGTPLYHHKTVVSAQPAAWAISSRTDKDNRPWVHIDSQLSSSAKSDFRLTSPKYDTSLEYEPARRSQSLKMTFDGKKDQLKHESVIVNDRSALKIVSSTEKMNKNLLKFESEIPTQGKWVIRANGEKWNADVEIQPKGQRRSFNVKARCDESETNHETEIVHERSALRIRSVTSQRGENKFSLESNLNDKSKSNIEIRSPAYDAEFEADYYSPRKSGKWAVNLKRKDIQHESQVAVEAGRITFSTKSQKGKRNLFSIDANASPQLVEVSYHGSRGKKQTIRIQNETPDRDSRKVTIKYLEDGKQVTLHENFAQLRKDGRGQVEILVAMTGKIEGKDLMGLEEYHFGINHKQNFRRDNFDLNTAINGEINREGQYQLKLEAQKSGDKNGRASLKANIQTPLSQLRSQTVNGKLSWEQSKINAEASTSNADGKTISLRGNGFLNEEQLELSGEVKSDFIDIPSAKFEGLVTKNDLKAIGHLNNKKQFEVSAHQEFRALDDFKAKVNGECAWSSKYEVEAQTVRGQRGVECQIKAKKDQGELYQVNASHGSQRNGWQSHVDVTQSGKPYARLTFSNQNRDTNVKLTYGESYQIELDSKMSREILSGPHDIVLNFGSLRSPNALKFHHEIGRGALKCNLKYFVDGQEKVSAENTGRYQSNSNGVELVAAFEVKSEYKYQELDGIFAGINHKYERRGNGYESKTQLKGQLGQNQKIQLDISSDKSQSRNEGRANFVVSLKTPIYDFQSQSAAALVSWKRDQVEISAKGTNRDGKTVEAMATLLGGERKTGRFEVKSDFKQVPSIKIDAASDRTNAHLNAYVNGERKVSITGKAVYSSPENFDGELDAGSSWTPRLRAVAKAQRDRQQVKYNFDSTTDGVELLSVSVHGQMDKDLMKSSARMSAQNSELFHLDFESKQDQANYRNRADSRRVTKVGFNCGAQCNAQIETSIAKDLMAGPHDIEMSMNARKPRSIKVHHEIRGGRLQNSIKYTVDGREEFIGEISGKVEGEAKELSFDSEIKIKSKYSVKKIDQLNVRVSHKHSVRRGSFEIDSEMQGNVKEGKNYGFKLNSKMTQVRGEGEATLLATLSTPVRRFEKQSVDGRFKWDPQQVYVTIKSLDGNNRPLEVYTEASQRSGKYDVLSEMKSGYTGIPSGKLQITADKRSASLTIDADGRRKLSVSGKGKYEKFSDFEGEMEGTSAWTPKYTATFAGKKESQSIGYSFAAKENNRELITVRGQVKKGVPECNFAISYRTKNIMSLDAKNSAQDQKDVSVITIALGNEQQLTINSNLHRQLISGPHDLKFDLVSPKNLKTVEVHHEMVNGKIWSRVQYSENGRQRGIAEVTGKAKTTETGLEIEGKVVVDCEKFNLKNIEAGINHRHSIERSSFETSDLARVQLAKGKVYQVKLDLQQKGTNLQANLKTDRPSA